MSKGVRALIITTITLLIILCVIFISYLFLLMPNSNKDRQKRFEPFEKYYIAHRGLFDNNTGDAPENSLNAFQEAIDNGYGIELDVQLTKDKKLVVFHDYDLKRMAGVNLKIKDATYSELQAIKLRREDGQETTQTIPLFEDVLELLKGKQNPLIVEIKVEKDGWKELSLETAKMLDKYNDGENKITYCVESFNPFVISWFAENRSDVLRGILSTDYSKDKVKMKGVEKLILTNMLLNVKMRPDFIAYNHKYPNQISYWLCRNLFRCKSVVWTVKNEKELKEDKKFSTVFIFDSFRPDPKTLKK